MGLAVSFKRSFKVISSSVTQIGPRQAFSRLACIAGISLAVALGGCSKLRPEASGAIRLCHGEADLPARPRSGSSNRTGTVENGDKLQILEHGRRFVKVQTAKGEQGWIDEKAVATQDIFDQFEALGQQHSKDPVVASAVVRDEVYMHSKPGRDSDRFYRLAEGEKLKLLARATLPKPLPPGMRPAKPVAPAKADAATPPPPPEPPAMEDWWLVRDSKGETGWLLSRMMDVDAPDSLTRYSEGQRMVGAYILTTVHDPDAEQENKDIPVYVTVLSPYKAGLPYDFDQVRVFTWNVKKHRYETGHRERNIEGYLPVDVKMAADPYGKSATATTPAPPSVTGFYPTKQARSFPTR